MKLEQKNVFWFWGGMDLFYLLQFIVWNVYHQRVPFYSDILAYLQLVQSYGYAAAWLYPLNVILIISIPVSMILFWRQSRNALWLAYAQTPLRLAFMLPSLSLVVWILREMEFKGSVFYIGFLLVSEAAKVVTLWRCRRA
ncbi:arginine:ornithine antiporter [Klebsiella grimontii]|uniref:arginine:ornithine antiporter n=1 Tax=Klebsiella grimontii TaxID=2058152 RepID=UPI001CCE53E4|nr:arginine:ornithine antiporter [Klebsiella grimontii]MBZ7670457.1 arginine:ornithine antiporter [Klebsiella grimontii]